MCRVATVAPFMSYDVAVMELFRGMTKRKNADQMNHLLQDVGRAKTVISTLTFETAYVRTLRIYRSLNAREAQSQKKNAHLELMLGLDSKIYRLHPKNTVTLVG